MRAGAACPLEALEEILMSRCCPGRTLFGLGGLRGAGGSEVSGAAGSGMGSILFSGSIVFASAGRERIWKD